MTEIWTAARVAQHFGVSESRARHILADNGIKRVYGYPADAVQAVQRPGQGARTDLKGHAMTTTTTIPGPSGDKELDGWYGFINGGHYTESQEKKLVEALLHEQRNEFSKLLPYGWIWYPAVSEIIIPFDRQDTEDPEELDFNDLLRQASGAVIERFEEIEAEALADPDRS